MRSFSVPLFLLALLANSAFAAHPLEPLTADEITTAVAIIRRDQQPAGDLRYPVLALQEPTKAELQRFAQGETIARRVAAVVLDRNSQRSFEATVDLTQRKLVHWNPLPNVHPIVLLEEYAEVADIVRKDPQWQAAMKKRGIDTDEERSEVNLDCWAPGFLTIPGSETARLMRVLSFRRGKGTNAYGQPIEGVVAVVDLEKKKVVQFLDTGVVPISDDGGTDFFAAEEVIERPTPKPLVVSQPAGVDFAVNGNEIRWQKWRFRYQMHPREGLVLHTVGYEEVDEKQQLKVRSILHRAAVAEMVVPYGDAAANWNWRSAFDQGEYGLGRTCNSLTLGQDVPANAKLFAAVFASDLGAPEKRERAVAIYEQDGGILWKHYDETSGKVEVRRARQLVVSSVITVGNYDYCLNWIFHQDGTLEARVDLTGILLAKGVVPQKCEKCAAAAAGKTAEATGDQRYGTLVGKSIVAPNHQHIFSFRLDFDIDGAANSVVETSVKPAPVGPENPAHNAFIHIETPLKTERTARRDLNLLEHRRWKVFNPTQPNELGHFPGYLLEPGANCVPKMGAESITRKRAGYIDHHFWATQLKEHELHAAGDYPRQRAASEGLPQWSGDESLEQQDVVLWYTMTVTHVPRAEEWPVMSAAHSGFSMVPTGFFTRNPALDVPAEVAPDAAIKTTP